MRDDAGLQITPQVLLKAYACGIFPMAESADDPSLFWVEPERRGVLPMETFHVAKRLQRTVRQDVFEVRVDSDFDAVIDGCAAPAPGRRKTWISERIRGLYRDLYDIGHCHTVECWQDGRLVGGLYGIRLGLAFCGESMFTRERDASKVALVHLMARLKAGGFTLLDTQFVTPHLAGFGAIEIGRRDYQARLDAALGGIGDFFRLPAETRGADVLSVLGLV